MLGLAPFRTRVDPATHAKCPTSVIVSYEFCSTGDVKSVSLTFQLLEQVGQTRDRLP